MSRPIIAIGRGVATSATTSHEPRSQMSSSSRATVARRKGSWSWTRRTVKPRLTIPRRKLCSSPSMLIIEGTELSGRDPWPEQNVCQSLEAVDTCSCDARPQIPSSSSQ
ncbi:MAG: hypothetical protein K0R11_2426 [Acidimicrobiales bacterium]|nr:hypothetical protein [Acidimicrobiales bacterium]